MKTTLSEIEDFLGQKRLALVGVSTDPASFSRALYDELRGRGYDVVPVNPHMTELAGAACYPSVADFSPPPAGALVMTPAGATDAVVRDCEAAGVRRVWLHRGGGAGSVTDSAVSYCREHGMSVVAGYCPYMFLPGTPRFHHIHGFFLKLTGRYPRAHA